MRTKYIKVIRQSVVAHDLKVGDFTFKIRMYILKYHGCEVSKDLSAEIICRIAAENRGFYTCEQLMALTILYKQSKIKNL